MGEAAFSVAFAGPLVTLQDAGRPGHMRYGVPASGPMDRLAFEAAHVALGNAPGQTAIEISLGGLILTCTHRAMTVTTAGGAFTVQHGPKKSRSWTILTVHKGQRLSITADKTGSWVYLAFAGRIAAHDWLGSGATHSTSGFGGWVIRAKDTITLSDPHIRQEREGDIPQPDFAAPKAIRVVTGPKDQHFDPATVERFLSAPHAVSDACDRMGMRLKGPELLLKAASRSLWNPLCRCRETACPPC